ncbi:O-acetyl-ADP-ribose deacetylase [uncultured Aquitalea sp.]|uniref:O-acetyl-ADP-ribose deacetylase n=1 Tax=uncultured Aquitalea sp. TaxID=540272 RepID=UPI0025DF126E|nr:O-acetyl-ADP-ribose deacetylase [uncultured Aquitalea sp.]
MTQLAVIQGDITTLAVDAIVNAANSSLLGGGGVDGAIHRAAGPALLVECRALNGCQPGEAKLTGGHDLPARHVIHTVGPIWQGGQHDEAATLRRCYAASLDLALAQGMSSIAFPAISCGVYGYPLEEACWLSVEAVHHWMYQHPDACVRDIWLVAFDERVAAAWAACGVKRLPFPA